MERSLLYWDTRSPCKIALRQWYEFVTGRSLSDVYLIIRHADPKSKVGATPEWNTSGNMFAWNEDNEHVPTHHCAHPGHSYASHVLNSDKLLQVSCTLHRVRQGQKEGFSSS
jgi:hypothetical protein